MKNIRIYTLLLSLVLITSCGENKKTSQTEDIINTANQAIKTIPRAMEEIEKEKETLSKKQIKGTLSISVDGKTTQISEWDAANSRANFMDTKANYILFAKNPAANVAIKLSGESIYQDTDFSEYSSTLYPYDLTNPGFMEKYSNGYVDFWYEDASHQKYTSAEAEVTVTSFGVDHLRVQWKGKAFKGDWREKNFVPFEAKADLQLNFGEDYRN